MLTTDQITERRKFVTRRLGWWSVSPGDLIQGVEKAMDLKKGQKVKRLDVIRVVSARSETLSRMTEDAAYGQDECALEGFPNLTPEQFVDMFCAHNRCLPGVLVNRIEFEYARERGPVKKLPKLAPNTRMGTTILNKSEEEWPWPFPGSHE